MKRIGCYLIMLCSALATGAILFLSSLSVWIGISHQEMDGYWMPVLFGSIVGLLFLYTFFRLSRYLFRQTRRTDSIDV
jgi:formate/nitrite transporter FocA (FNT family)